MRARLAAAVLVCVAGCTSAVATDPNPSNTPKASVLAVSPTSVAGTVGHQVTLTASVLDQSGHAMSGQTITWSSANTRIATVSSAGVVTLASVGSTNVSASADSLTTTVAVTVTAVPRATVASVGVTPASVSLPVGTSTTLSAVAKDSSGAIVSGAPITWTSSNTSVASVSASGVVSALAVGAAVITAASNNGMSGTSSVTVTSTAPTVASVTVSPTSSTIDVGKTVQLTATDKDAGGNIIAGQPVTWSSSNTSAATVSSSGLVSAAAAGTATITAKSGGKQGAASITVTAATGGPECANPKAGWIWCDDFETDRTSQYYEYSSGGGNFVRTAGAGLNGSTGMRAHYVSGAVDVGYLHVAVGATPSSYFKSVDAGTANYRELYWRVYVRYQSGWTGGGGGKLTRAVSIAKSDWSEAAFAHVWSGATGTNVNYLDIDPASGTDSIGNLVTQGYNDFAHMRWLGAVASTTPIFDAAHVGQWYCIEVHARMNDAGASNGVMQLYVNDQLQAQNTTMNWVGDFNAYGFNVVMLENYWNTGAVATENRDMDNFVVSTQPIGCGPTGG
jgi:uncharacterized protein YjdB